VKTSVDTTLVAPVELGDDAYTAAGSVITEDVPEGPSAAPRAPDQRRWIRPEEGIESRPG
jgi:bifunctional UDP-N-acetylglucosamine pyrophosphorylase/glucosamine-1-phosphate N-acetyltransferase